MRIRIDLKIFIFLLIFYFTNQIKTYLMIMFFCIIHEIGHIIVGLILKIKLEKVEIMPFGLSASFGTNFDSLNIKIKEIFVTLAGPLTSLALAILCKTPEAIYSNILILLFNLIPIYPLDGGRIIKAILHIKFGREQADNLINKISYITMIILTIISSIGVYYYKNLAIFMICIFLWIMVLQFCKENSKIDVEKSSLLERQEYNVKTNSSNNRKAQCRKINIF